MITPSNHTRLFTLFALLAWAGSLIAEVEPKRPNFVFIYTDDQRWDALSCVQEEQGKRGCYPWFQTPNMDRIAAGGVRFRNAFVTSSLCSPSRASFLTGKYNHLNGVVNNRTHYPTDSVSHATLLRQAGYVTAYVGKWHMGNQSGQRPGFDYSASYIAHGRYNNCPFEINGRSVETQGWVDDVATDYAMEFIRKNKDKPFDLVLGFKAPHGGWVPPKRLMTAYADSAPRPVPSIGAPFPPYGNPEPLTADENQAIHNDSGKYVRYPVETIRSYFRTLKGVDENVGRVLDVLDELKLADHTMVVFSSDNGFFHNEHGLGDKRAAYDESMRIPILVRYPPLTAKALVRDEMVLNIDLAPTILDFAGVPVPPEMQGRSWRPLLQAGKPEWRDAFFYEYFWEKPYATPSMFAVRTERAKLIKYPGHDDWTQLFDLKADPYELHNLASDSNHRKLLEQMQAEYEKQALAVGFKVPSYADRPGSTGTGKPGSD